MFHPLHSDVISVKNAAGKSVVTADNGAGLLAVTDLDPGTRVATGDNVTSGSRVGRTATNLRSVDAVARCWRLDTSITPIISLTKYLDC